MNQGRDDLYHLANVRQQFAEAQLGQIAFQLMNELDYLHNCGMVYKYLSPSSIIIREGLNVTDNDIRLRIADVAIMQLIDLPKSFNLNKMGGIDRMFMAPELLI